MAKRAVPKKELKKVIHSVRYTDSQDKILKELAESYADGDVSEWIRWSSLNMWNSKKKKDATY